MSNSYSPLTGQLLPEITRIVKSIDSLRECSDETCGRHEAEEKGETCEFCGKWHCSQSASFHLTFCDRAPDLTPYGERQF